MSEALSTDAALVATALDAASVVDDYIHGVMGLTQGHFGEPKPQRFARLRHALHVQERQVVKGFGFGYGPEQLRRASRAAGDLTDAVADLALRGSGALRPLNAELAELEVAGLAALLASDELTITSPALGDAYRRVNKAIGALRRAQAELLLARMRAGRPGPTVD